ncbi:MAG: Rieske 2Fe-2S domain-containing protein, partial [Planctomycetes bacterium]|nr:Rieske 2Fe-2S domain-containing protein [Planctomycetota bacterium]
MERRSFLKRAVTVLAGRSGLKWATNLLGGAFATLLGIPAVGYLLDPRNRPTAAGAFKRVGRVSELTENVPKAAVIRDIRLDAWTLHPNDVIGRVWLIRRPGEDENGLPKVDVYTTICPHLGGSINFEEKSQCFVCPLHGATYDSQCRRVGDETLGHANPAPRDMDSLEFQLIPDPNNDGD